MELMETWSAARMYTGRDRHAAQSTHTRGQQRRRSLRRRAVDLPVALSFPRRKFYQVATRLSPAVIGLGSLAALGGRMVSRRELC